MWALATGLYANIVIGIGIRFSRTLGLLYLGMKLVTQTFATTSTCARLVPSGATSGTSTSPVTLHASVEYLTTGERCFFPPSCHFGVSFAGYTIIIIFCNI